MRPGDGEIFCWEWDLPLFVLVPVNLPNVAVKRWDVVIVSRLYLLYQDE